MSEERLERLVGGFLVATAAALLLLVLFNLSGGGWLTSHRSARLMLDEGMGLEPGVDVTVAGLVVGEVARVTLTEQRKVEVLLRVEEDYAQHVKVDTVGRVTMQFTGKVVILEGGSPEAEVLPDGGTLISGGHFDLVTALERMDLVGTLTRLQAILEDINEVAAQMDLGDGDLPAAVADLGVLVSDVRAGRGLVGKALRDDELADELVRTMRDVDSMAKQLEQTALVLDSSAVSLAGASEKVATIAEPIERTATALDRTAGGVDVAVQRLVTSTEQLNEALVELGATMRAIQKLPLIRGQVKKDAAAEK